MQCEPLPIDILTETSLMDLNEYYWHTSENPEGLIWFADVFSLPSLQVSTIYKYEWKKYPQISWYNTNVKFYRLQVNFETGLLKLQCCCNLRPKSHSNFFATLSTRPARLSWEMERGWKEREGSWQKGLGITGTRYLLTKPNTCVDQIQEIYQRNILKKYMNQLAEICQLVCKNLNIFRLYFLEMFVYIN